MPEWTSPSAVSSVKRKPLKPRSPAATVGRRRACYSSWLAPHNVEGFFLSFGDMLLRNDQVELAQRAWQAAKMSPIYGQWKESFVLENHIEEFEMLLEEEEEAPILADSRLACVVCHQR